MTLFTYSYFSCIILLSSFCIIIIVLSALLPVAGLAIMLQCCVIVVMAATSSVIPKHLIPLTPESTKKNRNKHSQPPSTDQRSSQSTVKTNQQREIWVRSPSTAVVSRERSLSPRVESSGYRSPAVGLRSPSPVIGSLDQRSRVRGQRSNNAGNERGSAVFSGRSSSLSTVQLRTTTDVQQTSVLCYCFYLNLL